MSAPLALGAHTLGLAWRDDAAAAVERLAGAGFRRVEFFAVPGHVDLWASPGETASRVRRALDASGAVPIALDLSAHDYNLASLDARVAQLSLAAYARLIELAAGVGAPYVTVHGGRRIGFHPPPDELPSEALARAFERLATLAERRSVRLLIENIPPAVLSTAGSLRRFATATGYPLGFIYDVANATAIGEDPLAGLELLLPDVAVVHLSDCRPGVPAHAAIGSGTIDFAAIAALLAQREYGGEAVVEIASAAPLEDLRAAKPALEARGWTFRD